ncbi:uncharacterized protein LOC126159805 isoform X2 [Schistocerca cancellata]|uniref:uncharacterized protein LOC126159805 isoform X2 n=1 Tax=Schistocerca cancellata TaxID=274614 RepID=UPI0021184545|nr:uncharacterized protein LOC126159805 isoform X2 [Schistocerca cancellata]
MLLPIIALTAVMDHEKTIWIKEETSEISSSPGSIVQVYPSSVEIKEEPQETGNQELLQDPLKMEAPFYNTEEDPGLKLNASLSEHSVKLKSIDIGRNSVTEGEWMM